MKRYLAILSIGVLAIGCSDALVSSDTAAPEAVSVQPAPFESGEDAAVAPGFSKAGVATAAHDCSFVDTGSAWVLQGDCTTDGTILIPDGYTLDGNGFAITAVDPAGDHFRGAVVANGGATAHVKNLTVAADGLANACDAGADRLRGILFEGASGSITQNVITGINQGASGCQEGNAVEVRNAPFDGTHPNTQTVEIGHNVVADYQKTGIVANGDVAVSIHHNKVGASATQENLAANSVQLGWGATGTVEHNDVDGNQWFGFDAVSSNYAGSAVLVYLAGNVEVGKNNVGGNSDIGLYVAAAAGSYVNNRVFDKGTDEGGYDIGILNVGADNAFKNNKVRGFDTALYGVSSGRNKVVGTPNGAGAE